MYDVGTVVHAHDCGDERFVIVRIHFEDLGTLYDIQSHSDACVLVLIPEEELHLADDQDFAGTDAYDRAMRGI